MVGPVVRIVQATKSFSLGGGRKVLALDDLSLTIPSNSFVILMGPNGSGKTTLLRAIKGSLALDRGEISIGNDKDTGDHKIVHISQDSADRMFSRLTMAEHFLLAEIENKRPDIIRRGVTVSRLVRYREILKEYQRDDLAQFLEHPVSGLSGGMRQAVSILCGVIDRTTLADARGLLLLLDEPTASLDRKNERICEDLIGRLYERGATVVMVSHDISLAVKSGNRIVLLSAGHIFREYEKDLDIPLKENYNLVQSFVRELYAEPSEVGGVDRGDPS